MNKPSAHPARPPFVLAAGVCIAAVAGMAYLRLVVYAQEVVPLTYALALLLALWHRDLRLLWGMAACFLGMVVFKAGWVLSPTALDNPTRLIFASMQFANIVIPTIVIQYVIHLTSRLRQSVTDLEQTNTELEASNEELAAREEEINQQNEELQSQSEELEQQTEELSAQSEELQALNEQLAIRERTLADLLEASATGQTATTTLEKLGESIARLIPRAAGAAVLEPDGTTMIVRPLFGVQTPTRVAQRQRTLAEVVVSRDRAGFLADLGMRPDLDVPTLSTGAPPRAVMAAPLRTSSNADAPAGGALEIYGEQPGEWTEHDLRLLQWAAEQFGRTWSNARLRQDLDYQRDLLRAVTDNATAALFMLDDEGLCTYANAAAQTVTGFALNELTGQHLGKLLHADKPGNPAWTCGEALLVRKNAEQFPAACVVTDVRQFGEITGVVLEVRDVTADRQAAAEREELLDSERAARGEAERAGRAKDEFVSTLSHELRTPLNAVLGWATLLRRSPEKDLDKGLEVIERNARHQAQLISDLLDMSKIVAGKIRLDVQAVDLPLVVEAAIDAVRPGAEAKNVRIDRVIEPLDRMVTGDPNRLQQVVWNLLTNAVKFTPKGGSIMVEVSRVASYVQVSVTDTGQGIDAELLPHIFQRYRQGDGSATRQQGGLGLGLAIVKHLVELHGGTVHARSQGAGRGSSFSVLLPVRAVDPPETVQGEPHPATPAGLPMSSDIPSLAGLTILVVDDEADAREMVSRVLRDCGAIVESVGSADEALEATKRTTFHVLVSDIGMPGTDGYTLIRRLRGERAISPADMAAVALTAFARSEDRTRALLAGFQSHISKPVEAPELVATVASVRPTTRASVRQ